MQSRKYEPKNTIRRLQIKIPNFTHSKDKPKSTTLSKTKLYNSQSSHTYTYTPYHNNHSKDKNQQSQTPRKMQEKPKNFQPYQLKSPKQGLMTAQKMLKVRVSSKSPRNRYQSPSARLHTQKLLHQQLCKTEVNTSRNIDQVRNKLKTLSSKGPMMLPNNYFKKQIPNKLEDMNKTLRKMAQNRQQQVGSRKSKYELKMIKRLSKSQNGDIILAISNINGIVVVIKTFRKESLKLEYLIDEMKIHLYCQHPNILPAYGYHVGRDQVYLCMEFGFNNLYQEILRKGPFTEQQTAKYIMQILSGVQYLHRNGIIHRDLKPENIICFGQHLKITDFGWSIKTDTQRRTLCGTLDYISPEVAERSYYDNKIDCWSIGVLMYEMLMVKPPFSESHQKYDFASLTLPECLSQDCQDLLTKLLKVDPHTRISTREALEHNWIKNHKKYGLLFQRRQYKEMQTEVDLLFSV